MIGPDALLFDTFGVSFVSSQGFSKSDNPDVLKLFHRHSVWMIRISVLVKVNGIRHYSFIHRKPIQGNVLVESTP
jgi:hypothetical protein